MMRKLRQKGHVCLSMMGESLCIGFVSAVTAVSLICLATLTWVVIL